MSFEEQIHVMSKNKYLNSHVCKVKDITCMSSIFQTLFATRGILKFGEYPQIFPTFSWGIFSLIIHQIFLFAYDWSKHVTWPK